MTSATLHQLLDPNSVDITKPGRSTIPDSALARAAADGKRSYVAVLCEFARLRFGMGRLALNEYLELKLFDDEVHRNTNKKNFIGLTASPAIWLRANFRVDLFALATNKIASAIWFAAHGLPILPTIAIFHEQVGRPGARQLRSEGELRDFLRSSEHYPLFGKPITGCQSVGTASIENYDATRDCLMTTTGRLISIENFVAYVKTHAAFGYQFQSRISPHDAVRAMCGDRLATVRLLTIIRQGRPEILRACWKIPAGMHAADNFWRPGNLLAEIELKNGRVTRVIRATGAIYEEVTHHPDTGMCIVGMDVPNWQEVKQLALDAAKLLEELPLLGWDIAPVDSGAVLVESNVTPDFRLHQLADRRGMLEPDFRAFLRQRKHDATKVRRANKRVASRERLNLLRSFGREAVNAMKPLKR